MAYLYREIIRKLDYEDVECNTWSEVIPLCDKCENNYPGEIEPWGPIEEWFSCDKCGEIIYP